MTRKPSLRFPTVFDQPLRYTCSGAPMRICIIIIIMIIITVIIIIIVISVRHSSVHPQTTPDSPTVSEFPSIVAIFYPFSQFCEINISLLSLQTQPNTAPNLFQRGVEYGKYAQPNKENRGHRETPPPAIMLNKCELEALIVKTHQIHTAPSFFTAIRIHQIYQIIMGVGSPCVAPIQCIKHDMRLARKRYKTIRKIVKMPKEIIKERRNKSKKESKNT